MITTALAVIATTLTVARGWPQVSRIVVHKDVAGVSSATWTLMLVSHVLWTVWAIALNVPAVVIANVLAGAGCVAVLLVMARHCELSCWRPLWSGAIAAVLAMTLAAFDADAALAFATTVITAFMVLPQVKKAFQDDLQGISAGTWWLAVASSVTWSTYYTRIDHLAMIAPNLVIFPSAIVILARVYASRRNVETTKALNVAR